MRILIVDDHEAVRRGIRSLLSATTHVLCGEAPDGEIAVEMAEELKPDLILMDVSMPKLNGLEAARRIRQLVPHSSLIIVSQHDSAELVRQALSVGAKGYVTKSSLGKDLFGALRVVEQGGTFYPPI
jgi:two-component system, NarL family, nitrate/nitrite response regulator NarL